jgi:hypothetical protein
MEGSKDNNLSIKTIELRLTLVKEAMQRTRFVFIVMTIASSAILFTLWNDRFSRDKALAFDTEYSIENRSEERTVEPALHKNSEIVHKEVSIIL